MAQPLIFKLQPWINFGFATSAPGATSPVSAKWRMNVSATYSSGAWLSILETEWAQFVGGPDATGAGTASASVQDTAGGNYASKAFDNSFDTNIGKYQSGTATKPIWVEYDFPSAVTIEEVRFWPYAAGDTPISFDIQYDAGGGTWTTYWSNPDGSHNWIQNTNELKFSRYIATNPGSTAWRINITATQGTTGNWCSIQEIEFRGSVGGVDLTAPNSTDGGNAIANANGGTNNWPWWAFDGTGAPWQSGVAPSSGSPVYIGYRFPTQVSIEEVSITCTSTPGDAPKSFTIDYWNGSGWTTAWNVADAGTWTSTQTKIFTKPSPTLKNPTLIAIGSGAIAMPVSSATAPTTSTYNDTISESLTSADSYTAVATWAPSYSENLTSTDSYSSTAVFPNTLSEGLTAADALVGGLLLTTSLTESVTGSDEMLTTTVIWGPTYSEGLTGADSYASIVTFPNTLVEALTGADGYSSIATFPNALAEGLTGADSVASTATFPNTLSESLTAADALVGGMLFVSSLSEALTGADNLTTTVVWGPTYSEGLTGADSLSSIATLHTTLLEGLTGTDALASVATLNSSLSEAWTTIDAYSPTLTIATSITEGLTASEAYAAELVLAFSLVESSTLVDLVNGTLVIGEVLSEGLTANVDLGGSSVFCSLAETLHVDAVFSATVVEIVAARLARVLSQDREEHVLAQSRLMFVSAQSRVAVAPTAPDLAEVEPETRVALVPAQQRLVYA